MHTRNESTDKENKLVGELIPSPCMQKRREAIPFVRLQDIPERQQRVIGQVIGDVYNILMPRVFQIEAIKHCTFNDGVYLVVQMRTAGGIQSFHLP